MLLFAAENDIPLQLRVVDIFQGENRKAGVHGAQSQLVGALLEDGEFRLTESSAILSTWPTRSTRRYIPRNCRRGPVSTSAWTGSTRR